MSTIMREAPMRDGWRGCLDRLVLTLGLLACAGNAVAATYTVTTLGDSAGTCTAAGADFTCTTLRAAINASNATTTVDDTIVFSVSGTINITSVLPVVTDTVVINGGNAITLDGGGGAYAALMFDGSGGSASNSQLLNTRFTGFNQNTIVYGSFIGINTTGGLIQGNTITQPTQAFDPIRVRNSSGTVVNNNIINGGFYGVSVFNEGTVAGYTGTRVTNNTVTGAISGVALFSVDNVTVSGNTILNSTSGGIRVSVQVPSNGTSNNLIQNNTVTGSGGPGINVTPTGALPFNNNRFLGNTITGSSGPGISLAAGGASISNNVVTGNTIRGNGGAGVLISSNAGNASVRNNAIYANTDISANGGLGIDLVGTAGVTANDAGDGDGGPNRLQNYPVVTSVVGTTVNFLLDAQANANGYRIDFYNNPGGVDPSGHGEGQAWLGSCIVASPSATVPSSCTVPGVNALTLRTTATRCQSAGCASTATTSIGETSEFSGPTRGTIVIVKDAVPNDAQDFAFTTTGTGLSDFSLDDDADGTLGNSRTFLALEPGSYTVTEGLTAGWNLTGLTCVDPNNSSTVDLANREASIDLDGNETVTCTFTNTRQVTDVSIVKTPSANPVVAGSSVTFSLVVTNNGPAAANNAVVTDTWTTQPGLDCSAGPATCTVSGTVGTQCPAPASVTPAALQAGLTIPALPSGGVVTLALTCQVTATGAP